MNEIDALFDDQPREPGHVEEHRQRVLGRGREGHEHAADRLEFARHPSALRGDQRARPGATRAAATSIAVRSAPPASSRGIICNMVRPARTAFAAAESGERRDAHARRRARWPRVAPLALTAAAALAMPAGRKGGNPDKS